MYTKRLNKELANIAKNPPQGCSVVPSNGDMFVLEGTITGRDDSPYKGGVFSLRIKLPKDYPLKPPKVNFNTKIYHPNIERKTGEICLEILRSKWAPSLTISIVLLCIRSLMASPNPDTAFLMEDAELYKTDRTKYNEIASEWTKKYATPN